MKKQIFLSLLCFVLVFIAGCQTQPQEIAVPRYDRPLHPGQLALRRVTNPYEIPDFSLALLDLDGLREATGRSIRYLRKPSSRQFFPCNQITHSLALRSLEEFDDLLDSGLTGSALNTAIKDNFDVYMSVGCDNEGTVLFTGYYTPIFEGSKDRSEQFRYPLYKQPNDLLKGDNGEILGRRLTDGSVVPYPPRAVIEVARMLVGNELVWLSDPFEVYIAHVQGSAKIRLPDGKLTTVGYSASNGHEYKSISKEMIKDRRINKSQISLSTMIDYFKKHVDQVEIYVRRNPRYIFFRYEDGPPRGSLNEPVTPLRTIATDKSIFPRGCLAFIRTHLPVESGGYRIYSGFALDQDTGGAIRAAGRCDVYMGEGDRAGKLAGRTYQEGKLYYLFLKSLDIARGIDSFPRQAKILHLNKGLNN